MHNNTIRTYTHGATNRSTWKIRLWDNSEKAGAAEHDPSHTSGVRISLESRYQASNSPSQPSTLHQDFNEFAETSTSAILFKKYTAGSECLYTWGRGYRPRVLLMPAYSRSVCTVCYVFVVSGNHLISGVPNIQHCRTYGGGVRSRPNIYERAWNIFGHLWAYMCDTLKYSSRAIVFV